MDLDPKTNAVLVKYAGEYLENQTLYQSVSNPRVYSLGDVIDKIQLTPVAIAQARQWADMVSYSCIWKRSCPTPKRCTVSITITFVIIHQVYDRDRAASREVLNVITKSLF